MAEARQLSEYVNDDTIVVVKEQPKRHQRPKIKKHTLPKWYKRIYIALACVMVGLSLAMIGIQNRVTRLNAEIASIETRMAKEKQAITELKQEKSELSRVDRIMEIAKKAGLSVNNGNIRTINK